MARYVVNVSSPRPPDVAFDYMADLRNFAEWDPGVHHVEQVEGEGPGPGSVFAVTVEGVRGPMTLNYHTVTYEPPDRVMVRARSRMLTSLDIITVRSKGSGSVVTYDAELKLNGLLGLADPLLKSSFKKIGDRAAAGLIRALDGERLEGPAS